MTVNDIFLLKQFQHSSADAVDIVQTYHYIQSAGPTGPASDQLIATFVANVIPKIRDVQNELVETTSIECFCLSNPIDFNTDILSGSVGTATGYGDPLPSFVVTSFKFARSSRALRNGHKRYSGLSEGMVNVRNVSGIIVTYVGTLAAVLGQVLPASSYQFSPIIYGEPIPDRPGKPSPRTEPAWCAVASVGFTGVSTQNSRKK